MRLGKVKINHYINYLVIGLMTLVLGIMSASGAGFDSSMLFLLEKIAISIILAVSLSLVVGFLGELSLGHAGFMCIGAYIGGKASALLVPSMGNGLLPLLIALVVGCAAAAVCGAIVGIPALRLRGDYLAIVTLAFGEILKNIIGNMYVGIDAEGLHMSVVSAKFQLLEGGKMLLDGPVGATGITKISSFAMGYALILFTLFVVLNLVNSKEGRAIKAVRDNRIAAESIGINITKYKLMAFSISAGMAGIAGVLYAHNLSTLVALPKNFGYNMSITILVFVVLGGIGSTRGSMISAVILTLLPELLRFLNDYRMLFYAIVLIVMMLFNWSPKALELRERYSLRRIFNKKRASKEEV